MKYTFVDDKHEYTVENVKSITCSHGVLFITFINEKGHASQAVYNAESMKDGTLIIY